MYTYGDTHNKEGVWTQEQPLGWHFPIAYIVLKGGLCAGCVQASAEEAACSPASFSTSSPINPQCHHTTLTAATHKPDQHHKQHITHYTHYKEGRFTQCNRLAQVADHLTQPQWPSRNGSASGFPRHLMCQLPSVDPSNCSWQQHLVLLTLTAFKLHTLHDSKLHTLHDSNLDKTAHTNRLQTAHTNRLQTAHTNRPNRTSSSCPGSSPLPPSK
jgi:hypothetical protein